MHGIKGNMVGEEKKELCIYFQQTFRIRLDGDKGQILPGLVDLSKESKHRQIFCLKSFTWLMVPLLSIEYTC